MSKNKNRAVSYRPQYLYFQEVPNYDFEYQIHGGGNVFGHVEKRRETQTNGKYYVILPDFRRQVVSYYADETGYHATITYEPLPRDQSLDSNRIEEASSGRSSPRTKEREPRLVARTQKRFPKNRGGGEAQQRKQTRETPAEQILYALAQLEEHRHQRRAKARRSYNSRTWFSLW